MQHYIAIKQPPTRPSFLLDTLNEPVQDWQRKARALRARREWLLRRSLFSRERKTL